MKYETLDVQDAHGVAVIWLNRPEVRNAFNDTMVAELTDAFASLDADKAVRAVALAGRGEAFCGGADLKWIRRMGSAAASANVRDAQRLTAMFNRLYSMKKPTVARVHGKAYAGALGLIAACDIAVASQDAEFCLSEVKIGMAAATILPYLLRAMGERHTRRYVLSAEVFPASEAFRIGLVQELALPEELDTVVDALLAHLLEGGPGALATAKELIDSVSGRPITAAMVSGTAGRFAALRASDEGKEGMSAFLEKRLPAWRAEQSTGKGKKRRR